MERQEAEVRRRLAAILQPKGLKAEVARRLNEAPTWVSNRLTGYSALKVDELPALADALRMDVCDLACRLLRDGPEDHGKAREDWTREGFEIFGAFGRMSGQSMSESAVLDAIRRLLREYDEGKGRNDE